MIRKYKDKKRRTRIEEPRKTMTRKDDQRSAGRNNDKEE